MTETDSALPHERVMRMLQELGRRGVNEVLVEAGSVLNGALLAENLVDELLIYLAPKLLGQGRGMSNLGPLAELAQAMQFEFASVEQIGPDLRILARRK